MEVRLVVRSVLLAIDCDSDCRKRCRFLAWQSSPKAPPVRCFVCAGPLFHCNDAILRFVGVGLAGIPLGSGANPTRFQRVSTWRAPVSNADCTRFALRSRVDLVEAVAALLGFEYFT